MWSYSRNGYIKPPILREKEEKKGCVCACVCVCVCVGETCEDGSEGSLSRRGRQCPKLVLLVLVLVPPSHIFFCLVLKPQGDIHYVYLAPAMYTIIPIGCACTQVESSKAACYRSHISHRGSLRRCEPGVGAQSGDWQC
ncbi:hypothetical protein GGS23DRAFT_138884 [Durotheca rogersii]|uniref:uncharacterized protein n=1 Tax=Durotheca rogersii TaxID=419775 RepID=UPI00221E68A3|nr:uncharacterized protein GGS23DRAFT_138884 [Durotheca rogersii]KAI5861556.1 hypothetical protein GGS23DRAFT_138884 [Durotheca rogersii]